MTFWELVMENKVKVLGSLTVLVAFLLGAISLGQFGPTADSPALLDPITVRWMALILGGLNVLLGGGTVAAGFSNSATVKVEQAKATQASAMVTAINATPGIGTGPGGI